MNNVDFQLVTEVLTNYFYGLHHGDVNLLESICSPDLVLMNTNIRRPLQEWLTLIESRAIPDKLGHKYLYKILSLDIVEQQAMAKLYCPLLAHQYIDFIGLLKEQGQWKIVSKMYFDISHQH
ncbi:nuclear transport factor 2 family protein [Paraglaciecola sp.]|uniref:nuclear transport factor 2 family protein n=1 Tax=Paraglaciecola sp. TaxID=1920173 RepID=UPI003EF280D2